MAERPSLEKARREAVQPSLWDRLVDDLPGLVAEMARLAAGLSGELGAERVESLLASGAPGINADPDLDDLHRRRLLDLLALSRRRAVLEERGIVVTPDVLREAVRRDIEALFNIERFESEPLLTPAERARIEVPAEVIAGFPHARRSVLNFGVPSFAGRRTRDFEPVQLSQELRGILAVFEPRLRRDSIVVRVITNDKAGLRIEVEGVLVMAPVPERLRFSTTIDLDSGRAATRLQDG